MPHTWCSPDRLRGLSLLVGRKGLLDLLTPRPEPHPAILREYSAQQSHCAACVILISIEVGVASWEERQKDLIEHESLSQPAQACDHVCVLVLSEAVVEVEMQGSGQPFRTPVEVKCEPACVCFLGCIGRMDDCRSCRLPAVPMQHLEES